MAPMKWDYDKLGENFLPMIFSKRLGVEACCAKFITHEESALQYILSGEPG